MSLEAQVFLMVIAIIFLMELITYLHRRISKHHAKVFSHEDKVIILQKYSNDKKTVCGWINACHVVDCKDCIFWNRRSDATTIRKQMKVTYDEAKEILQDYKWPTNNN